LAWLLLGCALAAFAALIAANTSHGTGDYANHVCAHWQCDDPSASIQALARGDISGFFRNQPAMGLTSLALRAPAVALVRGSDLISEYQAGAAVCCTLAALIAVWVASQARRQGAGVPAVVALLGLWTIGILWARTLQLGHPEEALAAALGLTAVILAGERRPIAAGVALGLAIGTKEWALLLAPAVVFAGSAIDWRRTLGVALVAVALTSGVMAIGNAGAFRAAHEGQRAGDTHTVTPASVWFRLGDKRIIGHAGGEDFFKVYPPKLVGRWCRPFVILLAALMIPLFLRRRGFESPDALALGAALLVLRAILDTQTFSYHLVPMLMATAAWEVFARRRFPVVAIAAMAAFQLTVHVVVPKLSSYQFNSIYLAWTLLLLAILGAAAFRPRAARRSAAPAAPAVSA
jgi:hypothetical protein